MTTPYLTAVSLAFQERLVPGFHNIQIRNDPVFANIVEGSARVCRDPISKNYQVVYTYTGSLAGGLGFSGILGNDTITGTDRVIINDTLPAFGGLQDSAMPQIFHYSINLTRARGNIHMPFAALQANELEAALDDYPALVMKKHIELIGHVMACSWYVDDSGGLVQFNTTGNLASATRVGNVVTVTAAAGQRLFSAGRNRRLKTGMYVDIWNSTYTQNYNQNGYAIIQSPVRYYGNATSISIYFASAVDAAAWAATATVNNCWLIPREAILDKTSVAAAHTSVLPVGYQHFAINTGTLYGQFGSLNIANAPELMSLVVPTVGDITETVLNRCIAEFHDSFDGDIDSFFTTSGVMTQLLDYPLSNNLMRYERNGGVNKMDMGWDSLTYTYDGKEYKMYQSPYMSSGTFLGLKLREGNIQQHFPPKMPGTGSHAGYDPSVQWVGPMFGQSIWMPMYENNRVTEGMQAPYLMMFQRSARDPRSMVLTGCTENTL